MVRSLYLCLDILVMSDGLSHMVIVASIIAMLLLGFILLFVFALWDFRYAKRPVVALRFVKNRSILGAAWIGFLDFVSA